jgi:uncharacterized membrane protein
MARKNDLSTPRGTGGGSGYDSDAFARWAESVARFLGTGRYLAFQSIIVLIWIGVNVAAGANGLFDKYPFILLNLMFSTQAAYAAPLILLASNRQADRDKEEVERDRETNARALAEAEFLARELASVRIMLEQKADREDLIAPLEQLTHAIERLQGVNLVEDDVDEVEPVDDAADYPGS